MFNLANLVGGLAVAVALCWICEVPLGIAYIAGMLFFIGNNIGNVAKEIRKLREET